MSTDETWRHLRMLNFYLEYIDIPGVCMQKFVMINWILQYSWALKDRKYHYTFSMGKTFDARNIKIWV